MVRGRRAVSRTAPGGPRRAPDVASSGEEEGNATGSDPPFRWSGLVPLVEMASENGFGDRLTEVLGLVGKGEVNRRAVPAMSRGPP
jgi:hypothetical protein